MEEIICPHCNKVFTIDEMNYENIAKQVRDKEFYKALNERKELMDEDKEKAVSIAKLEATKDLKEVISDREMEIIARQAAKMEKKRPGQGYDHPEQLPDEKKNELLNINAERQAENKSHITSYAELFEKNHSEAKEAGAKDADRKAAQRAQQISNLRIAGENVQKEMKNAQKEINRDLGLR